MTGDDSGDNPVSMREYFHSSARNFMISLSVVALSAGTVSIQKAAAESVTGDASRAPLQRAIGP